MDERLPEALRLRGAAHLPLGLSSLDGQIVLVLHGGGALGAYQAGVYQALHEAGIEPDWVIGTSIGAINASAIAGNAPENRLVRLREFWSRVETDPVFEAMTVVPWFGRMLPNWATLSAGVANFFRPNPLAFLGQHIRLAPDAAGHYSTAPLQATLRDLIDFDRLDSNATRLTVGAANVRTAAMRYFDSRDETLDVRHVLASGALPPAFPAVRIGDDLYWDGGILSNTPVEAVFDDNPRRNSLIFAVHIWNPTGPEPESIWEVMSRRKDLQYSSRAINHIRRQAQIHRLRHVISDLVAQLPDEQRETSKVRELASYGCQTRMHVMRLLAPALYGEDHTKDIDFSRAGIRARWDHGYKDMRKVLDRKPWEAEVDPREGFYLHEQR